MSFLLEQRTAAFEQAAVDAVDPEKMALQISGAKSDRSKYDFCTGLRHDLLQTRAALWDCCLTDKCTSFGTLFTYTEGQIANLNRVLQNLKRAGEISFDPECFFMGVNDHQVIRLLDKFWGEEYTVDERNVFCDNYTGLDTSRKERKGRSYVEEDLSTRGVHNCASCGRGPVADINRMTVRGQVYHLHCISCVVCGAHLQHKADYITFDGHICCSSDCIRRYDGAHLRQERR